MKRAPRRPLALPIAILAALAVVAIALMLARPRSAPTDAAPTDAAPDAAIEADAAPADPWTDADGVIEVDIPYGDAAAERFDLYLPSGAKRDTPQGLMLFLHGGGWTGGDRNQMDDSCKRYARAGYPTATMGYTLIGDENPDATVLTMVDQIDACIRRIAEVTRERGYPIDRIALSGSSAGGHLALLYAYSRADTSPLPLSFVFERCGPTDFHGASYGTSDANIARFAGTLVGRFAETEHEAESLVRSISPAAFVDEDSPPTIIAHGTRDDIVPIPHAKLLAQKLQAAGVAHVFIEYPASGHALDRDPECEARYHDAVLAYARTYFGY